MKTYYLYHLIDPNTQIVRYIGVTYRPRARFLEHLKGAKKLRTHKDRWILGLLNDNQKPIFKIVRETPDKDQVLKFEIDSIANVRDLTNSTTGGEYFTFTPEVIQKLRAKRQNQPKHIWTPEEKHQLSIVRTGQKKNDQWKANIGLGAVNRKPVVIDGITYTSLKDIMRKLHVRFTTAQKLYKNNTQIL